MGEVIDFHKQPEIRNKNFSKLFLFVNFMEWLLYQMSTSKSVAKLENVRCS